MYQIKKKEVIVVMDSNKSTEASKFTGTYWQWLKSEFKGWSLTPWAIWFFGLGWQLHVYLATGTVTVLSTVTLLATLIGLLCCSAMAVGKTVNGLLGLVSAIGFIWVNASAGHWASCLDQVIFVALIDLPLMMTWRTWGQNMNAKVRTMGLKGWLVVTVTVLASWFVLYEILSIKVMQDPAPVPDALVLALGATASFLCFKHYTQTYTLWFLEDVANVVLWAWALRQGYSAAAPAMLVSTLMYFASAIYGRFYSVWHTSVSGAEPKLWSDIKSVFSK